MRLTIRHTTRYRYDESGYSAVQRLRLTPRDNSAQRILDWRIEAPGMEAAPSYLDGFGNVTHLIAYRHPGGELAITAAGTAETSDTGGAAGMLGEAASPAVFLRDTPLTRSTAAIDRFAARAAAEDTLPSLHNILAGLKERVAYETDTTHAGTTAAEAFKACQGVCQDHAHIFIAAARSLGVPARYVTGYLHVDGEENAAAHHAWAEAFVPDLGWVGFDAANGVCPTEGYVRLACGFDAPSAAPIVGTRRGGGSEELSVDVVVEQQQQ